MSYDFDFYYQYRLFWNIMSKIELLHVFVLFMDIGSGEPIDSKLRGEPENHFKVYQRNGCDSTS